VNADTLTAPTALAADLADVITDGIVNHPRSLQARIGPSELGMPCEHCLAAKLAGWTEARDAAWLPTIGTAVHAWLAEQFTGSPRWLVETRVDVGELNGVPITGSADLYDLASHTVVDWKVVGRPTLQTVKADGGPSPQYRTQAHLYGRGFARAGHPVRQVAIAYLYRNGYTPEPYVWTEPYDEGVATAALDRATAVLRTLDALHGAGADVAGYIGTLDRAPRCYSCPRYPDAPAEAGTDLATALGTP
jgi:hypothetical protein